MGRKLLLPTLTCLSLASLVSGVTVQASGNPYSDNYWSLSEVLEFKEDLKNEVWDYCRDSSEPYCEEMYYEELRWRDNKSIAVGNLKEFLITSISPKEEKIRYFYQDENEWNMFSPSASRYGLAQLYLGWFNMPTSSMDYGIMWDDTNDRLASGVTPILIEDYFEGPYQEVEREAIQGSFIGSSLHNEIYYWAIFENHGIYGGPVEYNDCLASSPYANTECRLMFDKNNGERVYLPFEIVSPQVAEPEPEPEPEPEIPVSEPTPEEPDPVTIGPAPDPIVEPEPTPAVPEPAPISETEEPNSELELAPEAEEPDSESEPVAPPAPEEPIQSEAPESITDFPATPDTGAAELSANCGRVIEFPWWITLLVAAGEALIIWWFAPTVKNRKKV